MQFTSKPHPSDLFIAQALLLRTAGSNLLLMTQLICMASRLTETSNTPAFPVKTGVENINKSPKTQQHVQHRVWGWKIDFITSEFSLPESLNESDTLTKAGGEQVIVKGQTEKREKAVKQWGTQEKEEEEEEHKSQGQRERQMGG